MRNHILKEHVGQGDEECYLLKIEGAYDRRYWLYVDMAKDKALSALDRFLREIWLECCGHMSEMSVGKKQKLNILDIGDKINHEYDMGSPTETLVTVVAETRRPKQKKAVRLLARNAPIAQTCADCGAPAELICQECRYDSENPHYCEKCAEPHACSMLLTITNSPRNGECGYDGELDTYEFNAANYR
jgi:hypothetical protein